MGAPRRGCRRCTHRRRRVMHANSPVRWYWLAACAALSDQASRFAVASLMPFGASIPITDFFNLVHARNTGAAFSFLAQAGGWQRYFLTAVALAISAWIVWLLRKRPPVIEACGFSLVLGGALGNVVDRIARGHVVDYLDFHLKGMHWPAFNLADTFIMSGVALLLWASIAPKRTGKRGEATGEQEAPP